MLAGETTLAGEAMVIDETTAAAGETMLIEEAMAAGEATAASS